jgi:hypothetical protein
MSARVGLPLRRINSDGASAAGTRRSCRSRLRAGEQIAAAHRGGNGVGLNGCRTSETEVANPFHEIRVETKTIERQLDGVLTCISKDAKNLMAARGI